MTLEARPDSNPDNKVVDELFNIFMADHSPDDPAEYEEEIIREIIQGKTTWAVRNWESEVRIYDLYDSGVLVGFVEYEDQGAVVYSLDKDGSLVLDRDFQDGTGRQNLVSAVSYLEDKVNTWE